MTAFMIADAAPIPIFDRAETNGDSLVLTELQLINITIIEIDDKYKKIIPMVTITEAFGISFLGSRTSEAAIAMALTPL